MLVFVVVSGADYEGSFIEGVFLSWASAMACAHGFMDNNPWTNVDYKEELSAAWRLGPDTLKIMQIEVMP